MNANIKQAAGLIARLALLSMVWPAALPVLLAVMIELAMEERQ